MALSIPMARTGGKGMEIVKVVLEAKVQDVWFFK